MSLCLWICVLLINVCVVYVCTCVFLYVCLHMCSEPRAAFVSSPVPLCLISLEARSPLNMKSVSCSKTGSQHVPVILPDRLRSVLGCRHARVLGLSSAPSACAAGWPISLAPLQSLLDRLLLFTPCLCRGGLVGWGASNWTQGPHTLGKCFSTELPP